jgi:membrane-associated protease RseP (regulator of RpoE activity)
MEEPWNWEALLRAEPPVHRQETIDQLVHKVLTIQERETIRQGEQETIRWTGTLQLPADEALDQLTLPFRERGFTAFIQEADATQVAVIATPGIIEPTGSRLWLALLLFALTLLSTFTVGGLQIEEGRWFINVAHGLMFSGALVGILLAHELGHFLAARQLGVTVSYPFFIPFPLSLIGTMGAFIQMKEPPPNRSALFTIAVAGPLAGLVLAVPLTLVGLMLSTVEPLPTEGGYILEGNNLLYGALKWLVFGQWLPSGGMDVMLHPIAFAGWVGMLVTALNLLPAGQLDGGHIIFGMFGRRVGQRITYGVIGVLILLGFVWNGWWIWSVMIFFLANRHAPILNDVTPIGPKQRLLAIVMLIVFALIFTPLPLVEVP